MIEVDILIAMPIYRQSLYIHTLSSLMALKDTLCENHIKSSFIYVDSFDVILARNMISTYFYQNKNFTHLLFIDDDMVFPADNILELLASEFPFTACICPKRQLDTETLYIFALDGKSLEEARATALDFVVGHNKAANLVVEKNFCKLKSIGMAVTLLGRQVFDQMVQNKSANIIPLSMEQSKDSLGNPFHYGFFDRIYDEKQKGFLGEDFSFCHRWTEQCGGEIYGLVTAKIGHVGVYNFEGRYIDSLTAGKL